MTTKRYQDEFTDRQMLQSANWSVQKTDSIQFNSGSETYDHLLLKLAAGYYLKQHGFRVDSEVEMDYGTVDILGYGHEDKRPIIVEVETNPDNETLTDKRQRYLDGQPVREMFVVDPTELSNNLDSPLQLINNAIGWGLE